MKQYGLCTSMLDGLSLKDEIERIVGAGFRQIELWASVEHMEGWVSKAAETRRVLASAGIVARSVHSPVVGWHNGSLDEAIRLAAIEATTACFQQAAAVGAELVVCHPNRDVYPYSDAEYEASWGKSCESLAVLAERARVAGVRMAVENVPKMGQPRRQGSSISHILQMIEGLGDNVGICLDTGHANANGLIAADEVREAGDKLFSLHLHDNDGLGQDQHRLPGNGTIDWGAFFDALDEIGFEGIRMFEVGKGDNLETTLAELVDIRRAWETRA